MSLYEDLGIPKGASAEEIKRAYKRLASKYHPDRETGDTGLFQMVNRAHEILKDPERRKFYDQHGVDKNEGPSLRARALQQLQMSFMMMLMDDQQPTDVDHEDVIEKLRQAIRKGQAGIPERKDVAERKIGILERTLRRLKRTKNDGDDFLRMMIEKQINGIRVGISSLETEKIIGDEMLKILEEYYYQASPQYTSSQMHGGTLFSFP